MPPPPPYGNEFLWEKLYCFCLIIIMIINHHREQVQIKLFNLLYQNQWKKEAQNLIRYSIEY